MEPTPLTDIANLLVASVALIVALISGFYTWQSFSLQRASSSPGGLHFMIRTIHRKLPIDETRPIEVASKIQANTLLGVHARGPGVRYNVALAVWGDVEARFLGDTRTTWAAEDGVLSAEIFGPRAAFDHPVYFGVIWESRSITKRRFVGHGYRVRLKWDMRGVVEDNLQVWSDRAQSWRDLPSSVPDKDWRGPAHESSALSRSLYEQMFLDAHKRHWV